MYNISLVSGKQTEFPDEATSIPNRPVSYLKHYYGYIGENEVRDLETGYWREKE